MPIMLVICKLLIPSIYLLYDTNQLIGYCLSICRHTIYGYTTCSTELTEQGCNLSLTEYLVYPIFGFVTWKVMHTLWVS